MAIIRLTRHENKFTSISNLLLNDPDISFRAKGLLCYLLSKPPTWNVNVMQLTKASKEGKDAVYSIIKELETAGYLQRQRLKTDDGKFEGIDYIVYEEKPPQRDIPEVVSPHMESPAINKDCSLIKTISNKPEQPTLLDKKKEFIQKVYTYVVDHDSKYPIPMIVAFCKHWTEATKTGKTIRYDEQKFFEIGKRLSFWSGNTHADKLSKMWEWDKEHPDSLPSELKKLIDE